MSRAEPAPSASVAAPWPDRLSGPRARPSAEPRGRASAAEATTTTFGRGDLYGVLILLLLTGLVAVDGLQQGRLLFRTDIITAYLPWYSHLGERLRDLDIPGWLPYSFSGAPFAGDPESGWMYLPAMVIFTIAPGVAGFNAFILFHLIAAGLATYALGRLLGMGVLGAVVAGAAYEFGGYLERARCCTVQSQVGMWLPVAFIGIEMATRARTWLARVGWWSLTGLAASQMLTGALGQFAYYGLLAVGAYTLYRTLISPPAGRDSVRSRLVSAATHGAAILTIGLGLAAAGIWPRLEVVERSLLEGGDYENVSTSEPGWSLLTVVDRLLTLDNRGARWYAGGAVLALAVLAPLVARRRASTPFWTIYSLLAVGLAARDFWLHELLSLLPRFDDLHSHAPERALTIFYIGPAMLAGATVSALARPAADRLRLAVVGLVPIALALPVWDALNAPEQGRHGPLEITIGAVIGVCALVVLAAAVPRPLVLRLVGLGLLLLIFADPTGRLITYRLESPKSASFIGSFHGPSDFVVAGYTEVTPAAAALQRLDAEAGQPVRYAGYDPAMLHFNGTQRTYVVQYWEHGTHILLVNNRSVLLELEDVQGYNPIQSARYVELMEAINGVPQSYHQSNVLYRGVTSPLLNLLNVRYLVIPTVVPPGRPDLLHLSQQYPTVYADADVRILERTDALPRAWIVHDAQRVSTDRVFKLLTSGAVDPATEVLLDKDVERPRVEPAADSAAERVDVVDQQPDEMTLDVEMTSAGLVVLSQSYDPGWHAYVDGERVPFLAAYRALGAVPVPAGSHTVELRYEPPSLMRSLAISLGTAGLLAVAAGILLWRRAIGRPVLVGSRVEGWLAPGRSRGRRTADSGFGAQLDLIASAVAALPAWLVVGGLTVAGAIVRFIDITRVAPELADRLLAPASDRPWSAVAGRGGLDASAPPLFVLAAKLARAVGIERLSDQAVSIAAGAVAIPLAYLLGVRLLGRGTGLAAAAVLAVSPLNVALSRSGEPAAAGLLLIAVSYLALVTLAQTNSRTWLVVYVLSLVAAAYTDPVVAAYGLLPHLVVGPVIARRRGAGATRAVLAAAAVGLLASCPWLIHLLRSDAVNLPDLDRGRDDYLNLLWVRVLDALPLTVGLRGLGSWVRDTDVPLAAIVLLAGVVPAGLAGLAVVRGRSAGLLCWATVVTAPILAVAGSLLTDGFSSMTLAPALIGWPLVAGAWAARRGVSVDVRRWGAAGWAVLVLTSAIVLPASYDADRGMPWHNAAPYLTSQAHLGLPIFVETGDDLADRTTISHLAVDEGAADGTDAWLDDPAYEQIDATELEAALTSRDPAVDALWLIPDSRVHLMDEPLGALGYDRVLLLEHDEYDLELDGRLELWARPSAALGPDLAIDGGFRAPPNEDDTWRLSGAASIEETPTGERTLNLPDGTTGGSSRGTLRLPGGPGLYLVEAEVWSAGPTSGRITVKCAGAGEEDLVRGTVGSADAGTGGAWEHVAAAVICPEGTVSLALVLDRRGEDPVAFRTVTLSGSPTDYPTGPPLTDEELAAAKAAEEEAESDDEEPLDG